MLTKRLGIPGAIAILPGTVEQTGTDSDCNGGSPVYYAWYEFYPAFPVDLGMTIKPGRMDCRGSFER